MKIEACTCTPSWKRYCSRACALWGDNSDLTKPAEPCFTHLLHEGIAGSVISRAVAKTESKMDVNEGDIATIEVRIGRANDGSLIKVHNLSNNDQMWVRPDDIKSVEPAPPGVGDTVTWDGEPVEWIVLAIDGSDLWTKDADGRRYNADAGFKGFRIIKRAEAK